ncbi:hypothetical protein L1S32_04185 [Methanogenium sp. S4BF]|uniref:formyltransferase family protein n=1 Tax=Methanogenium sp. S4BF TaxID=1789226 RepID=UPI002416AAB7|nr:formyltransferase family protein [Methanogenium sp. S4BF]WFN35327.1 hypothetical protein L1S32_04185 [Methanogenium sp. S4BF]
MYVSKRALTIGLGVVTIIIIIITQGMSPIMPAFLSSKHTIAGIAEDAPRIVPSQLKRNLSGLYEKLNNTENLHSLCKKKNIPYYYLTNENQDLFASWVRSKNPDIIAVYSMSHLLNENILSIPKCGAVNLHPSLLPSYRGPNPFFWMYYNMEKSGGVTVHFISKGEDNGEIIFQEWYDIPPGSDGPELNNNMIKTIGVPLFLKAIDAIERGDAPKIIQPVHSPTLRARQILSGEQKNIIDWEKWDIERIWHVLRGYAKYMDLIEPPGGIYAGQRWDVGEYQKDNADDMDKGVIIKLSDGYCIAGNNGIIQLSVDYRAKNTLYWVFNQGLHCFKWFKY